MPVTRTIFETSVGRFDIHVLRVAVCSTLLAVGGSAYCQQQETLFACEVDAKGSKYKIAAEIASNQSGIAKSAKLSVSLYSEASPEPIASGEDVLVDWKEQYNYAYYKMGINGEIHLMIKQFVGPGDSPPITAEGTLQGSTFSGECEVSSLSKP